MSITSPTSVREYNRHLLYYTLIEKGPLSRTELVDYTALSSVTVNSISKELIERQLIYEIRKTEGNTGRPASVFDLHPNSGTLIGLDFQKQELRCITANLRGESQKIDMFNASSDKEIINKAIGFLERIIMTAPHGPIKQVTAAFPAPITHDGLVLEPNALPSINLNTVSCFLKAQDISFVIENDANLLAMAEQEYGAARDASHFMVLLERNTGVGLGLVLGGKIYRGIRGKAGELALASWPQAGVAISVEQLPLTERLQALSYIIGGIAAALDIPLLITQVLNQDAELAKNIQTVFPSLALTPSELGDYGPLLGALSASKSRYIVKSTRLPDPNLVTALSPSSS